MFGELPQGRKSAKFVKFSATSGYSGRPSSGRFVPSQAWRLQPKFGQVTACQDSRPRPWIARLPNTETSPFPRMRARCDWPDAGQGFFLGVHLVMRKLHNKYKIGFRQNYTSNCPKWTTIAQKSSWVSFLCNCPSGWVLNKSLILNNFGCIFWRNLIS